MVGPNPCTAAEVSTQRRKGAEVDTNFTNSDELKCAEGATEISPALVRQHLRRVRDHEKALCRAVALTPYAREELEIARKPKQKISKLERAGQFLISSMMAINGVFGKDSGGFSYSDSYARSGREARVNRWYNLPKRISKVVERLRNVRVENKDARKLLKQFANKPATLVYSFLAKPKGAWREMAFARTKIAKIFAEDGNFHWFIISLTAP